MNRCRGGRAGNVSMTLFRGRNEGMSEERESDSVQTLFFVRAGFFSLGQMCSRTGAKAYYNGFRSDFACGA